jgi:hypothetical protein
MLYKLNTNEVNKLDEYWEFIDTFNKFMIEDDPMFSVSKYRNNMIKVIKKKYTAEEFYFFEKILNKLLWNLLEKYEIKIKDIQYNCPPAFEFNNGSAINKQRFKFNNNEIFFPLYKFIHTYNETPQNLMKIFHALRYREIYEKLIKDKDYIKKIKEITYYYPNDYMFPNINLIFYNINKKSLWIKRIKAYYYSNNDSNWYKIII